MAKVKPDGNMWALEFNRYVCFSLHGQGQQSCQKWKKSKMLFKSYRVNKNLRPAVAYEPVQKHKVHPVYRGD